MKYIIISLGLLTIFLLSYSVIADVYWSKSSFGGEVTINEGEPNISDESPTNGSTNEDTVGLILSINVTEYQGDKFNITWTTNATEWVAYNSSCDNGTFTQDITWADSESTTYWWNVSVNDTNGNWNNKTFHFTTGSFVWSNWSAFWVFNLTSIYDVTLDMEVDINDITSVTGYYGETGDPGWIDQDLNNDGEIDILDIAGVGVHYGEDYT